MVGRWPPERRLGGCPNITKGTIMKVGDTVWLKSWENMRPLEGFTEEVWWDLYQKPQKIEQVLSRFSGNRYLLEGVFFGFYEDELTLSRKELKMEKQPGIVIIRTEFLAKLSEMTEETIEIVEEDLYNNGESMFAANVYTESVLELDIVTKESLDDIERKWLRDAINTLFTSHNTDLIIVRLGE